MMSLAFAGMSALAGAQVSAPAFDVVSIKPAGEAVPVGRPSPGVWRSGRSTLVQLIGRAHPEFAFSDLVAGGPAWVHDARFEIDARMAPTTTPAQLAQMISALLADRFALRAHTERRAVNVYVLKVARDDGRLGPRLRRSDPACVKAALDRQPFPPECRPTATSGMEYRAMQIADFTRLLSAARIDRPVLDRTGLSGHFDLQVDFDYGPPFPPVGNQGVDTRGGSFFTALQEQAGLKLEAARELVEVMVVDSARMPTPN